MWIILAGVSILVTGTFVFNDRYSSKPHYENQQNYSHDELCDNDKNCHNVKSQKPIEETHIL